MAKQLIIDGELIEVDDGITLLQACEEAGAEIPRFCYHERLSIAGNCRMCLVEVVGVPKPIASCAMGVNDLRPNRDGSPNAINTRSPLVKKAREGVMEFLLINHPLDCPICDQGGECDLQDQAMAYGVGGSRFALNKRAVEEKYLGPLIKTHMTRCIQCTRCVRFMTEVAGVEELGAIGRGEDMEITTYLEQGMLSELSANVVDLCPVGALTHRPWAHNARPWELRKTESIDVMDAVGSAIRVDTRGREVMRILPRTNDPVNEEWISDKARHVCDGLRTQRLDRAYIRKSGRLEPASWDEALAVVADRLRTTPAERIGALAGDLCGAEEMFALADMMRGLGVANIDCRQGGEPFDPKWGRASYLFNTGIAAIDETDDILLIGTNPRTEAAVLNGRIRKRWRQGGLRVRSVGPHTDFGYDCETIGTSPADLARLVDAPDFIGEQPMVIVGAGGYRRADGLAVLAHAAAIAQAGGAVKEAWNGFAVLQTAAARVAGLDLGLVPSADGLDVARLLQGDVDVIYNLGADEVEIAEGPFVIYQGSHGDRGAHRADVILPGATFAEKGATFVNTEGRAQMSFKAAYPPGDAKEDWTILRALSDRLERTLDYNTVSELRAAMYRKSPSLARIGAVVSSPVDGVVALARKDVPLGDAPFRHAIEDFYLTNPIARASKTMAELSAMRARGSSAPLAAE
ncbi:MAG: NADH-quinone oxidoreductase subunit NuoG [Pseudomonadota bacterium]